MKEIGEVTFVDPWGDGKNSLCSIKVSTYARNPDRLSVGLFTKGGDIEEPFLTLSCNIPGLDLEEGEFFVKDWSENAQFIQEILATGLFINTGKRVKTGMETASVWKLAPKTEGTAKYSMYRTAKIVITCPKFLDMTEDQKAEVIQEVEVWLNTKQGFQLASTPFETKVGVRVHIK